MSETTEQLPPKTSGVITQFSPADLNFQIRVALQAAGISGKSLLQWVAEDGKLTISIAREVT